MDDRQQTTDAAPAFGQVS